ncbi:hypothetical protein NBRC116494_17250 [Aurantivibrio plasticivorans]
MLKYENESSEAVLFVRDGAISREMLYSEFEAVLDGYVPMLDVANQDARAVYLRIDGSLNITAAVFFNINFDEQGFADKRWNVPLQQFADNSARGPDLGAGAIKLACRSQCAIAWHQQNLWDPEMTPGANTFVLLKKVIKHNRLGLSYVEPVEPPSAPIAPSSAQFSVSHEDARAIEQRVSKQLKRKLEQEFRDHMARLLKEQRLRILTLNSKRQQEVHQLQLQHQTRLADLREQINAAEKETLLQIQRNSELKEIVDGQASKIEGLREYYEHKLKSVESGGSAELQAMKEGIEAEVQAKVEAATLEVKEQLQMREIELMYRGEQESSYQDEIDRLRSENQRLLANSSEQLLEKLERAGLNFVAYHPGAGHLTIPLADMSSYLEDPIAFAAKKCGVSKAHYKEWLEHYQSPRCQAIQARGELCGDLIDRVPAPSLFHAGENDRCDHHKTSPTETLKAVRM